MVRLTHSTIAAAAMALVAASSVPGAAAPSPAASAAARPTQRLVLHEELAAAAMDRAQREKKLLFVDVWAGWCHTCLSMKNFVLGDPALAPLGELAVFSSIDFDRSENSDFVAKYAIKSLPTFLVLDPRHGEVLGSWTGSGSARELRTMVELAAADHRAPTGKTSPVRAFAEACAARANRDFDSAASRFREALDTAPSGWPLRDEALLGYLNALDAAGKPGECVSAATSRARALAGSSTPADIANAVLSCAAHLPDNELQRAARNFAIGRLRSFVEHPPEGASIDDRGDASASLADALQERGENEAARAVRENWIAMLNRAASEAPSVAAAHTFDYQRANAWMALGRPDEAIALLEERTRQLPDDYEPAARLAGVLVKAGRPAPALPIVRRAIALAYGPPKLRYLALEAKILGQLGDHAGEVAALEEEVRGWQALPSAQAGPAWLDDASKRLERARIALTAGTPGR
jgi:thioredoxin-like negative regulator of GroEL